MGLTVKRVAELFANGCSDARSYGALKIKDGTLYSYDEPIAKRIGWPRVWVTSRKFSVTTSKHTNYALRALSYGHSYEIIRSESPEMCRHCKQPREKHADKGKCLFDATSFEDANEP